MPAVYEDPIIFIAGNSRSGTTMMGRMLGKNDSVHTFQELHFFEQLWEKSDAEKTLNAEEGRRILTRLLNIERNGYFSKEEDSIFSDEASTLYLKNILKSSASLYADFLQYECRKNSKQIPCKQTPQNIFYYDDIAELFPKSKWIIMVRDPRDILLSQKEKWKRRWKGAAAIPLREALRAYLNYHPITISKLWNAAIAAGIHASRSEQTMIVRYEDLLHDPQQKLKEICAFTNIPYSDAMLHIPHKGSSTSNDSSEQGIIERNAGKWIKGGIGLAEVYICQKLCKNGIDTYGYARIPVKWSPMVLVWQVFWPFKLALSLLFNLHRMRNIGEGIRKRLSS